jgi:hypothetical protein
MDWNEIRGTATATAFAASSGYDSTSRTASEHSVIVAFLLRGQTKGSRVKLMIVAVHESPTVKAFGRRPRCKPNRPDRPSSETLHRFGSRDPHSITALIVRLLTLVKSWVVSLANHPRWSS